MADWSTCNTIADRVQYLRRLIPDRVTIVAVTKTVSPAQIREAYAAGIRDFGENRIQEALEKQAQLQDLEGVRWHFIGHLQRNKAKQAIAHFQWIHSVDSLALLQRLHHLSAQQPYSPKLCLQIKLRPDPSKYGWTLAELWAALPDIACYQPETICGLMTILPQALSPAEQQQTFQDLANLAQKLRNHSQYPLPITELSMGMSNDFEPAIQAGATMIRPGRVLFGERHP